MCVRRCAAGVPEQRYILPALLEACGDVQPHGGLVGEVSLAHNHPRHQVTNVLGVIDDEEAQLLLLSAHNK